ncbi:Cation/H(+) antiporter 28 [Acorus calamus]|uniref:Cation/H(+) antiporter 28 n=1 Tax=Acorus calamus TaxID=4465 RepID=A0AAV9DXT0_ACOCL|nr:Cation/H(+) antiporter 28 [Acorus calamus]
MSSSSSSSSTHHPKPHPNVGCWVAGSFTTAQYSLLVFNIFLVFFSCKSLHLLLKRFRQPRLISEFFVGLVAGNVGYIRRGFSPHFVPTVDVFSRYAVMAYLFVVGGGGKARVFAAFIAYMANTSSPLVARLTTELKIGKSDVGRLVVSAAVLSDMASTVLMAVGAVFASGFGSKELGRLVFLAVEAAFIVKVAPQAVEWFDDRNPEGKHVRGSHVALAAACVAGLCASMRLTGYDPAMAAFVVGLSLPREGRISRASGAMIAAMRTGLRASEVGAVGILLNVRGHYHIFMARAALEHKVIGRSTFTALMLFVAASVSLVPMTVGVIVRRERRRTARGVPMAVQWADPSAEMNLVVCLHGAHNVAAATCVADMARGAGGEARMSLYAMDLVEMNDRAAATLVTADGTEGGIEAVTVADEEVVELREQIGAGIKAYERECDGGVTVRRLLAVSKFASMHEDVCNAAEDVAAVLIVLPFHKSVIIAGGGHASFQQILKHAPCSVAILVDRGLGRAVGGAGTASCATQQVAVIFVGGRDDREALALTVRMSRHPGVSLTAVRLLPEAAGTALEGEAAAEMEMDDECFAEFYERNVAAGRVGYVEKYVASGRETVRMLKGMEGLYGMFVVGRGGSAAAAARGMMSGLRDWEAFPELGLIGDVLASQDFSTTASVLVVQQHFNRRHGGGDRDVTFL